MPLVVYHCTVKANNNSLGNRCRQFVDFSVVPQITQSLPARTCNNVCGHIAIITETRSTYVMIESTLRFDDIEDIPGLLPLLQAVQRSRMQSRERSGRRPGSGARGGLYSNICLFLTICLHKHVDIVKSHDNLAAAIRRNSSNIGHAPRESSQVCWYFLQKSGSKITCSHQWRQEIKLDCVTRRCVSMSSGDQKNSVC